MGVRQQLSCFGYIMVKKLLTTIILTMLFILGLSGSAWAEKIILKWYPNSESDLAGYRIYYGKLSGGYNNVVDVGNKTTYTIEDLVEGKFYYIKGTAYDTSGNESEYSEVLTYPELSYLQRWRLWWWGLKNR